MPPSARFLRSRIASALPAGPDPGRAGPGGSAQLDRRPGGADHQHVVPHGLVVDVDPDHRVGAQLGRLLLHLGQRIADPGSEFVLVGLGPAAEDVAHAGAHVLERIHPEHALGGDDAEVFGHGTALDPGGGGDQHFRSSLPSLPADRNTGRRLFADDRTQDCGCGSRADWSSSCSPSSTPTVTSRRAADRDLSSPAATPYPGGMTIRPLSWGPSTDPANAPPGT